MGRDCHVDFGAIVTRFATMNRSRKPEAAAPALRSWRISVFRKRLERLGRVAAPDQAAAEAAAVDEFRLQDHERKRLLIEEVS